MSRIGKQPVQMPTGVSLEKKAGGEVVVKGPKGELMITLRPEVDVTVDKQTVQVSTKPGGEARATRAYHGLTRALINNMVEGVHRGFAQRPGGTSQRRGRWRPRSPDPPAARCRGPAKRALRA